MSEPFIISKAGLSLQDIADHYGLSVAESRARDLQGAPSDASSEKFGAALNQAQGDELLPPADDSMLSLGEQINLPPDVQSLTRLQVALSAVRAQPARKSVQTQPQSAGGSRSNPTTIGELAALADTSEAAVLVSDAKEMFRQIEPTVSGFQAVVAPDAVNQNPGGREPVAKPVPDVGHSLTVPFDGIDPEKLTYAPAHHPVEGVAPDLGQKGQALVNPPKPLAIAVAGPTQAHTSLGVEDTPLAPLKPLAAVAGPVRTVDGTLAVAGSAEMPASGLLPASEGVLLQPGLFVKSDVLPKAKPVSLSVDWLSPKTKPIKITPVAVEPAKAQPLSDRSDPAEFAPVEIETDALGTVRVELAPALVVDAVPNMSTHSAPPIPSSKPLITLTWPSALQTADRETLVLRALSFDIALEMPQRAPEADPQFQEPIPDDDVLKEAAPIAEEPLALDVQPTLGDAMSSRLGDDNNASLRDSDPLPTLYVETLADATVYGSSMGGPQLAYEELLPLVNAKPLEEQPIRPQALSPSVQAEQVSGTPQFGAAAINALRTTFQFTTLPMRTVYDVQSARRWWLWYRNYTQLVPMVTYSLNGDLLPGTSTQYERR